jgi:hypothetical protein
MLMSRAAPSSSELTKKRDLGDLFRQDHQFKQRLHKLLEGEN